MAPFWFKTDLQEIWGNRSVGVFCFSLIDQRSTRRLSAEDIRKMVAIKKAGAEAIWKMITIKRTDVEAIWKREQ